MGADRPRLAFVVPRYGPEVLGGAETHCRVLAESLAEDGADVEVLTTCASDHFTWRNDHPPGASELNGVTVRRFRVSDRDQDLWWSLHTRIGSGAPVSYADELAWMANSVWSEDLLQAACDTSRYDWAIPIPYLFGTSFWVGAERRERTALISCLHDEPYARLPAVRRLLAGVSGCMVSTRGERELLTSLAPSARTHVVGVGFDDAPLPAAEEVASFCARNGVAPGYLLYAGRREEAKGLGHLFAHYAAYRRSHPDAPPLALMGSGAMPIPDEIAPWVVDLGFVRDEERAAAYAGASVLVHPSRLEALGMVLMESWLAGTPALVNAGSIVLRQHCADSGGGLWYHDEAEFQEALDALLADPGLRASLASGGGAYAREVYSWTAVRRRFYEALDAWS